MALGRAPLVAAAVGALSLGLIGSSCSDSPDPVATDPVETAPLPPGQAECSPAPPVLNVDEIDEAIAALAEGRNEPPRFFEVNATASVVNLFLADTDETGASIVVPHSYGAGELRAEEPTAAEGNAFPVDVIDIDPERVLSCVVAELPDSEPEAFVIEGGPDGAVRYSVVLNSSQGGQLVVEVSGEGRILAVDAV